MVLVISREVSNLLSALIFQKNYPDLTDWILVEKFFNEHLKHPESIEKPGWFEIRNQHCFRAVQDYVKMPHHSQAGRAFLRLLPLALSFLYNVIYVD